MTTPTPRWTAEAEAVVAAGIHRGSKQCVFDLDECLTEGQHRWEAREVLTALADAGVLTAVGGETRQEPGATAIIGEGRTERPVIWGVTVLDHGVRPTHTRTITTWPDGTTLTGPWREVTDDPA